MSGASEDQVRNAVQAVRRDSIGRESRRKDREHQGEFTPLVEELIDFRRRLEPEPVIAVRRFSASLPRPVFVVQSSLRHPLTPLAKTMPGERDAVNTNRRKPEPGTRYCTLPPS